MNNIQSEEYTKLPSVFAIPPNVEGERKKRYMYDECQSDMTYILGARCIDGVVLVGDTKVTIDRGADSEYSKKIITNALTNVVMGSAGASGLYRDFQNRIITEVIKFQDEETRTGIKSPYIYTETGFSSLITKVVREMHNEYGNHSEMITYELNILCATKIGVPPAKLNVFTGYGFPEPVNRIRVIGHGKPYGALFHKKLWNQNMTIEQTAKLGLFIISLINKMDLDNSVGYNEEYPPQVVFIPDNQPIKELLPNDVSKFMEEMERNVDIVDKLFEQGKLKI